MLEYHLLAAGPHSPGQVPWATSILSFSLRKTGRKITGVWAVDPGPGRVADSVWHLVPQV